MAKARARTFGEMFNSNCSRETLLSAKREAFKAAKDLGYNDDTIERICNARSVREISNIMKTARKEIMDE